MIERYEQLNSSANDVPEELSGAYSTWKKKDGSGENSNRHTYIIDTNGKRRSIARLAFNQTFESVDLKTAMKLSRHTVLDNIVQFPRKDLDQSAAPSRENIVADVVTPSSDACQEKPLWDETLSSDNEEEGDSSAYVSNWPSDYAPYASTWPTETEQRRAKTEHERSLSTLLTVDHWVRDRNPGLYEEYREAENNFIDGMVEGKKKHEVIKAFTPTYMEARDFALKAFHKRLTPENPENAHFNRIDFERNMANLFLERIADKQAEREENDSVSVIKKKFDGLKDRFTGFKKRLQGKRYYAKTGDFQQMIGNKRADIRTYIDAWYHHASLEERDSMQKHALAVEAIDLIS